MDTNGLAKVLGITAMATARFQQERNARLMLPHELHPDLVHVRPMIPALPPGAGHDLFSGFFVAVVASIDMNARAIQMANAGRKPQALSSGRGHQAVELSAPLGIEGRQRPAQGIIVELFGRHTRWHQAVGGLRLEKPGDEGKRLIDTPSAMEHHRFDGFTHGEVPQFRVVVGGLVDDVAHPECVEPASHQAEVV
jgi:hypothetical protein